jgi:hypothetical protein
METVGGITKLQTVAELYFSQNNFMNKRVLQDIIHVRYFKPHNYKKALF